MSALEIVVIVAAALFVVGVIAAAIVRKKTGKPSCGCDCGSCGACGACSVRRPDRKADDRGGDAPAPSRSDEKKE